MKQVSDLRPRKIRRPSPNVCDQRLMQSKTQHSTRRDRRSQEQSEALRDYRDQREDGEESSWAVRGAYAQNSLNTSRKSQSIGLPSLTFPSKNCSCSISLLTFPVYLFLSSLPNTFSTFALSTAFPIAFPPYPSRSFTFNSRKQNSMHTSICVEQNNFFTFSNSPPVLSPLLYDLQSEPSFSLCLAAFSSSLQAKFRYRSRVCVSRAEWRCLSSSLEQNLRKRLRYY